MFISHAKPLLRNSVGLVYHVARVTRLLCQVPTTQSYTVDFTSTNSNNMTTVTVTEKPSGDHILVSPLWLLIVRGFQFVISLLCLALSGNLLGVFYLDEFGLNVAIVRGS